MALQHQPIWALPIETVYSSLGTTASGLAEAEAVSRLQQFGPNELPTPPRRPLWLRFTDQLTHFMALLLWVAGALAFVAQTPALGWAIWAVIWINALFSFWQEFQAEQALAALKKVLPLQVKVYRSGTLQQIPARELVRGDLMQLEEGDRISADARLVRAEQCYVDVSVLTGESLPVARNAYPVRVREAMSVRAGKPVPHAGEQPLREPINVAEVANLVLAGSTMAAGRALAVVYATGAQTEFGQVAHLTTVIERETSTLEIQVKRIVRVITTIAISMGVIVFLLTYLLVGMTVRESFIFAIGIIVALVPEGLLPTVTLTLAMGVQRMAKQNALVRRLSAVETLSATSVICTDKTGTLTKNEMTVRYLWLPGAHSSDTAPDASMVGDRPSPHLIEVTGTGYDPTVGTVQIPEPFEAIWKVQLLLLGAALCSNARLIHPSPHRWQEIGDPTEAALLVAAVKAKLSLESLPQQFPRLREVPFDSRRRMMTVVLDWRSATSFWDTATATWLQAVTHLAMTKGAPLEVLRHCHSILRDGTVQPLTQADHDAAIAANDHLARQGFRVLGVAARPGDATFLDLRSQDLEQNLVLIGLIAMFDPPRPEVAQAIAQCHTAGIKVTMVTGDYGLTAAAIARKIGLVNAAPDHLRVITGHDLGHLSDAELRQILKYRTTLVFARMAPEHKLRLVQAYKDIGAIVAVTGDGVNDAPALRAAHIGIAMGLSGTDVAREAADIVLTDDNFATIVSAVEQGRAIYQNIRKFMTYILSSNVAELVPFLAMVALKIPPALIIMQILAVDLGTDMLPALALGTEQAETGTMQDKPRAKTKSLLDRALLLRAYCFLGLIEAAAGMFSFFLVWWSYGYGLTELQTVTPALLAHTAQPVTVAIYAQATTMTLVTIVACQDGNIFACRSEKTSIIDLGFFSNPLIWLGILFEWTLVLLIIHIPFLSQVFFTTKLTSWHYLLLLIFPPLVLGAEELRKLTKRMLQSN